MQCSTVAAKCHFYFQFPSASCALIMKKTIFLILVFFASGKLMAQSSNDKSFNAVPYLGMNYTSTLDDFTRFTGGFAGGIDLRLGKTTFFQPGLQYAFIAFNATLDTSTGAVNPVGRVKGHYISVPLLIGYKLIENKVFNLRVQGGFNTSLFINGKVDRDNIEEEFRRNVNSIRAGVGFDIVKLTIDLNADIGVNHSLKLPEEITTFRLTGTVGWLLR